MVYPHRLRIKVNLW